MSIDCFNQHNPGKLGEIKMSVILDSGIHAPSHYYLCTWDFAKVNYSGINTYSRDFLCTRKLEKAFRKFILAWNSNEFPGINTLAVWKALGFC